MPHPDLEELLNALIPFAQQMLAKHGEFFPFGATMDAEGQVNLAGADTGDEHPEPTAVIDLLTRGFRDAAGKGEIRAAAICFDARVVPPGKSDKSDAIAMRLEHRDGQALRAYVPYRKPRLFGKPNYADLFATQDDPAIFPASK